MGKKVRKCNTSDINQSYTISAVSVLPPPTLSYAKGSRKDKGKGRKMAENCTMIRRRGRKYKGKTSKVAEDKHHW